MRLSLGLFQGESDALPVGAPYFKLTLQMMLLNASVEVDDDVVNFIVFDF